MLGTPEHAHRDGQQGGTIDALLQHPLVNTEFNVINQQGGTGDALLQHLLVNTEVNLYTKSNIQAGRNRRCAAAAPPGK